MEGIVASSEPIAENQPNASGLNFRVGLGGGIRWIARPRGAVSFGYRGATSSDPGVDYNVFYVGYSFLR